MLNKLSKIFSDITTESRYITIDGKELFKPRHITVAKSAEFSAVCLSGILALTAGTFNFANVITYIAFDIANDIRDECLLGWFKSSKYVNTDGTKEARDNFIPAKIIDKRPDKLDHPTNPYDMTLSYVHYETSKEDVIKLSAVWAAVASAIAIAHPDKGFAADVALMTAGSLAYATTIARDVAKMHRFSKVLNGDWVITSKIPKQDEPYKDLVKKESNISLPEPSAV